MDSKLSRRSISHCPGRLSVSGSQIRAASETLVMLLGGGRGERLLPLTTSRCKPAVPFAGHYRIIDFTLSNCLNSGLRRIGVLTQFKSQLLQKHLHKGWDLFNPRLNEFVEVIPAQQQKGPHWYEGTADALYQNLSFIESHDPKNVLILAGDHIYQADYRRMIAHHQQSNADITVAHISVPLHAAADVGVLSRSGEGLVTHFQEKPLPCQCTPDSEGCIIASMGIYLFKREVLEELLTVDAALTGSSHDFGKDILPAAIKSHRVVGYAFDQSQHENYWQDVGTLDAYHAAHMSLLADRPSLALDNPEWPMTTYQAPWPPTRFLSNRESSELAIKNSLISPGCIIDSAVITQSVLSSGVRVQSGSRISQSVILPNVQIGTGCKIHKAIIDEGSIIPDGAVIGEDTGQCQSLFHCTEKGITVVKMAHSSSQEVFARTHEEDFSSTSAAIPVSASASE